MIYFKRYALHTLFDPESGCPETGGFGDEESGGINQKGKEVTKWQLSQ